MTRNSDRQQLNIDQIELHLKSAVDALTPNVFDRIDLSTPQEAPASAAGQVQGGHMPVLQRRLRGMVLAAAACFCLVLTGGGAYHYQYQNRQVDSVIGIDVNPSVELSINRKNRVLRADPLNEDAREIMEGMDLEGVDLNVAVNAVIGSMVTHGYLDDLENAILVTVSNDSIKKATSLRTSVVGDIEQTLEENQVRAVVYDQQVIEKDEMKEIAGEYGISYGKAYFLTELIGQNQGLTMDDMEELSSLSMEEIAKRITESSLALGEFADKAEETKAAATAEPTTAAATAAETTTEAVTEETTTAEETKAAETTQTTQATTAETTEAEPENVEADRVKIDYAEYEDGMVYVYFVTHVNWKNPTVAVRDEEGNSYAALVEETSSDECSISVHGLQGGRSYTFVLGGMTPKEGGSATTVTGYFEKPEIAGEATEPEEEETEETTAVPGGNVENSGTTSGTESGSGAGNESNAADGTQGSDAGDPSETETKEETTPEETKPKEESSGQGSSGVETPPKNS